jgi:hypothetical protein
VTGISLWPGISYLHDGFVVLNRCTYQVSFSSDGGNEFGTQLGPPYMSTFVKGCLLIPFSALRAAYVSAKRKWGRRSECVFEKKSNTQSREVTLENTMEAISIVIPHHSVTLRDSNLKSTQKELQLAAETKFCRE